MGFFTDFFNAISNVSQGRGTDFGRNTGAAIDSFQKSVSFSEPTRVDNFLLGPNESVNPKRDYFQEGQDAFKRDAERLANIRDPEGRRTDPETGRSARETQGREDKSTASTQNVAPPPAPAKKEVKQSILTPPVAPKTIAEEPSSSGDLEDEVLEGATTVDKETGEIKRAKKGRAGTILTSGQGLLTDPNTRSRRRLKGLIK